MTTDIAKTMFEDKEKFELMRNTFFRGCSNDEIELFKHICIRTGLDPFAKQIYAVKRWDNTLRREVMTAQTGIDGYRLISERTGCYAPGRDATYTFKTDGSVESATAYVKKLTKDGTWHEVAATAFYDEYVQRKKDGTPSAFWLKMQRSQLAKCAEALAHRKAFPGEMMGVYTREEMAQAEVAGESDTTDPQAIQPDAAPEVKILPKEAVITTQQAADLDSLIGNNKDLRVNILKFLMQHFGAASLAEMPESVYDKVRNNVMRKNAKAKEKQTGEE
jgi:phage recombination protein Bet